MSNCALPLPGLCRTINGMATKRVSQKPNLAVVQPDSRTATQKRKDNLVKAQAALKASRAKMDKSGPTNLERYRDGTYPVGEWDSAEIRRGRPRGREGFSGLHPALTGRQQGEIKRELLRRGQNKFDSMYADAIKVLHDVAKYGEKDADRVKAALAIKEMVAGKVPERIEIKSSDPWQDILDEVLTDEVLPRVPESVVAQDD